MTARLAVRELSLARGGKPILDDIAFAAEPGEFLAIVGPNGSGKTTLLRSIVGVLRSTGSVVIGDDEIAKMSRRSRARRLAFISAVDDPGVDDLRVREVVAHGRFAHRQGFFDHSPVHEERISAALAQTEIAHLAEQRFVTLSSGERRRVWIALGLAQDAQILVCDEPTAHLDIRHVQRILMVLRRLVDNGRTVITVLHDLNDAAQYADRIALIEGGKLIAFDTPASVLTKARISQTYDVPVDVITAADGKPRIFPCL